MPAGGPQLTGDGNEIKSLPPCPGESQGGGGLGAGAIAGIVVGCAAGASREQGRLLLAGACSGKQAGWARLHARRLASARHLLAVILAGAALIVLRRRRQAAATSTAKLDGFSSQAGAAYGSALSPSPLPSTETTSTSGAGGAANAMPFNPFAGGPQRTPTPPGSNTDAGLSSGGSQPLPLSAATSRLQSGGTGGSAAPPAARAAALAAKLEALEREAPPWLLSPARLSMEHSGDGRLVLLGAGAFARVYSGYLAPAPQGSSGARSSSLSQPPEPPLPVAIKVRLGSGCGGRGVTSWVGSKLTLLAVQADTILRVPTAPGLHLLHPPGHGGR